MFWHFPQAPRHAREESWGRSSFAWPVCLGIALPRHFFPVNHCFFTSFTYICLFQCIFMASKCLYTVLDAIFLVYMKCLCLDFAVLDATANRQHATSGIILPVRTTIATFSYRAVSLFILFHLTHMQSREAVYKHLHICHRRRQSPE